MSVKCRYCQSNGHYKSNCPKLAQKKAADPAYASAMKKGLGEPLTKEEQRAVDSRNKAKTDAVERHKAFLEREERRKSRDEERSAELREQHGPYWYRYVKGKKDDTDIARGLRQKEEEAQYIQDNDDYFEDARRDREANERWQLEEDEREKMTPEERLLDEQKQDEDWEAYCLQYDSAKYYAKCFREEKQAQHDKLGWHLPPN